MANPSKRIGTEGENYGVAASLPYFPDVDRAKTNNPGDDLNNRFPLPVEIRRRDRWEPQKWGREQQEKFDEVWAIWFMARDRRKADCPPNMIAFPEDLALRLLRAGVDAGVDGLREV